jgi:hypothetical protein
LNTFPSILTHNTNSHSFSNIWTWFTEAFNQIEHELHSFSTNSKYVGLIGDFNSRTGEDDDYVNVNFEHFGNLIACLHPIS